RTGERDGDRGAERDHRGGERELPSLHRFPPRRACHIGRANGATAADRNAMAKSGANGGVPTLADIGIDRHAATANRVDPMSANTPHVRIFTTPRRPSVATANAVIPSASDIPCLGASPARIRYGRLAPARMIALPSRLTALSSMRKRSRQSLRASNAEAGPC